MAQILGTLEMESRNCPGWSPGTWELITPDCRVQSRWGLNQSCSPRWDLSNVVSHSQIRCQKEVDSRLLVVGSQTASLTPGPSFAHNLGYRYSNDQCEAIFDIYVSRPFQWHQEHLNSRCFGPCCQTLNIRESSRTPSPQLWECWVSPPHLAKVGLRHIAQKISKSCTLPSNHIIVEDKFFKSWFQVLYKVSWWISWYSNFEAFFFSSSFVWPTTSYPILFHEIKIWNWTSS